MDPLITSTIIGTVGSALSGVGSWFSGSDKSYQERAQRDFIRDYISRNGGNNYDALYAMQEQQNQQDLRYQQGLMDMQEQANIRAEQRQLSYNDPAFLRARAEAAGYNPNVALGSTSAQAMQVSTGSNANPSSLAADNNKASARQIRREEAFQNMMNTLDILSVIDQKKRERTASDYQLKAMDLDNQAKGLSLAMTAEDYSRGFWRFSEEQRKAAREQAMHNQDLSDKKSAAVRSQEAHKLSMSQLEQQMYLNSLNGYLALRKDSREQGSYDFQRTLDGFIREQYALSNRNAYADLADKSFDLQWRRDHGGEKAPISRSSLLKPELDSLFGFSDQPLFNRISDMIEGMLSENFKSTLRGIGKSISFGKKMLDPNEKMWRFRRRGDFNSRRYNRSEYDIR